MTIVENQTTIAKDTSRTSASIVEDLCQIKETIVDHLMLVIPGLGLLATFWGITWKMSQDTDKKVTRMFQRFDEYKEHLESTHTRKEVCDVKHEQLRSDVMEIKKDVKELIKLANGKSKG